MANKNNVIKQEDILSQVALSLTEVPLSVYKDY